VQIPRFPEAQHPLIQPLAQLSDQDLLTLFQRRPDQGRYFTAILCRYTLLSHSAKSPVQADYLFAQIWRHIFYELGGLDLRAFHAAGQPMTLQTWIINLTALMINQAQLPPVEQIHYDMKASPPVLWCYVEQALELMPPPLRLITIMAQTYRWSENRIAAYLQAEGDRISPAEVKTNLQKAYQLLEKTLPLENEEDPLGELGNLSEILR
jgi:hypothetical protein